MMLCSLRWVITSVSAFSILVFSSGKSLEAQYLDTADDEFIVGNAWLDFDGGWTYESPWYYEAGGSGQNGFNTSATNVVGTYRASYVTTDLTSIANVTSLTNYSPSTAYLYEITFSDPWREAYWGTVAADGDYDYYVEIVIDTVSGPDYTATSQKIDRATFAANFATQFGLSLTWDTDPFAGLGVPLSNINDITYNVVMDVNTPTSGGDGWLQVQGFNLQASVGTVPEPTSVSLICLGTMAVFAGRRR